MTTTETVKPAVSATAPNKAPAPSTAPVMVTLEQLARDVKMSPRDARMVLRLAAKQIKLYPTLGKDHVARQPWQWTPGSKALEEARKALAAAV